MKFQSDISITEDLDCRSVDKWLPETRKRLQPNDQRESSCLKTSRDSSPQIQELVKIIDQRRPCKGETKHELRINFFRHGCCVGSRQCNVWAPSSRTKIRTTTSIAGNSHPYVNAHRHAPWNIATYSGWPRFTLSKLQYCKSLPTCCRARWRLILASRSCYTN